MADIKFPVLGNVEKKLKDMGDGTHAEIVYAVGASGGGASTGLTDTQLRAEPLAISATALPLPTGAATAAAQATGNASVASVDAKIGALADVAATSDVGSFNLIALIKRSLANWTSLLARIPTQITPGLLPVDTLGTPDEPYVRATGTTATNIVLKPTCRRLTMYATEGTWYSRTGAATATSHYIGKGERLDFDVPANTTISVLQETVAGSIRISELT